MPTVRTHGQLQRVVGAGGARFQESGKEVQSQEGGVKMSIFPLSLLRGRRPRPHQRPRPQSVGVGQPLKPDLGSQAPPAQEGWLPRLGLRSRGRHDPDARARTLFVSQAPFASLLLQISSSVRSGKLQSLLFPWGIKSPRLLLQGKFYKPVMSAMPGEDHTV